MVGGLGGAVAPVVPASVRIDRLTVRWKATGVVAVRGVSLAIAAGERVALVGPNGAGKSTLLQLMMGLLAPTSGRIVPMPARSDPTRTALVFQRPVMLRRSAAANVAYALEAADRPASPGCIRRLLERVALGHCHDRPARHLSAGEQQRLALARALAREPHLLLLDEPTASLDPAATKMVEDIVRDIAASGVKVVMSTHDLGQARRLAGDVALLAGGRLVEYRPAPDFFERPATETARRFLDGQLVL